MKAATNLEDAKALAKMLSASSPGEYVITDLTGDKASIKFPPKRIMFQIGYDEKELNARAELFRRVGHEVISVPNNDAAKQALACRSQGQMIGTSVWLYGSWPQLGFREQAPGTDSCWEIPFTPTNGPERLQVEQTHADRFLGQSGRVTGQKSASAIPPAKS